MTSTGSEQIDRLVEVLKEERNAIGELDTSRLVALVEEKEALVSSMVEQAPRRQEDAAAVAQVLAEARANALLIETAIDLLSEHLGQNTTAPTYDERGRVSRSSGSAARTRI